MVGTVDTDDVGGGDKGPGEVVGEVTMRAPEASPAVGVGCDDDCADD